MRRAGHADDITGQLLDRMAAAAWRAEVIAAAAGEEKSSSDGAGASERTAVEVAWGLLDWLRRDYAGAVCVLTRLAFPGESDEACARRLRSLPASRRGFAAAVVRRDVGNTTPASGGGAPPLGTSTPARKAGSRAVAPVPGVGSV